MATTVLGPYGVMMPPQTFAPKTSAAAVGDLCLTLTDAGAYTVVTVDAAAYTVVLQDEEC